MNKFLYVAELAKIKPIKSQVKLISLMSIFSSKYFNRSHLSLSNKEGRLPNLNNKKENQLAAVYWYSLFTMARKHYIELGFNIKSLPRYAQQPPLHIDLDATIAEINQTNKLINN